MRISARGLAAPSMLLVVGCTGKADDAQYHDPALLEAIIEDLIASDFSPDIDHDLAEQRAGPSPSNRPVRNHSTKLPCCSSLRIHFLGDLIPPED